MLKNDFLFCSLSSGTGNLSCGCALSFSLINQNAFSFVVNYKAAIKNIVALIFLLLLLVASGWNNFATVNHSRDFNKKVLSARSFLMPWNRDILEMSYRYTTPELTLLAVEGGFTWEVGDIDYEVSVKSFANQAHIKLDRLSYFRHPHAGHTSYTVVYGHYKTQAEAQKYLSSLPAQIRKFHPHLRSMASVHAAILHRHS